MFVWAGDFLVMGLAAYEYHVNAKLNTEREMVHSLKLFEVYNMYCTLH